MTARPAAPAFRPGQRLTVIAAAPFDGRKGKPASPPFAVGDTVECERASAGTVLIKNDNRLWKAARFVAAR